MTAVACLVGIMLRDGLIVLSGARRLFQESAFEAQETLGSKQETNRHRKKM